MTRDIFLTLAPILFPIIAGFALFSRPIFEDRHIYVGVMTFATAAITFFAAFVTKSELITLWRVTCVRVFGCVRVAARNFVRV